MRDYLRTVELVEALARMVNRVIQHGKAEAQSALGSIEEIRTTLAAVANIDDFFDDLGPLWRCDKPSNERLDLCCRVSICQMRENGPESAPEGHGRAPRANLLIPPGLYGQAGRLRAGPGDLISYRDLEAMLADRGVAVDHTTMYR